MSSGDRRAASTVEVVLPAADLEATLAFFTDELGFQVESIYPADAPRVVVVAAHGIRLRLDRNATGGPTRLVVRGGGATTRELVAPNGTRISFEPTDAPLVLPALAPSFVVSRELDGAPWITGRAGMLYRELLPGRQGGRFVASHIRIPSGGTVPDYVHYHGVTFQVIFCRRGRVRVVYEDQGEPFWMEPGDCVLQPPEIRHRVLECSDGLEVVEISCPAEHVTRADPGLELPTRELCPERNFGGQRFVHHHVSTARWERGSTTSFEACDTGIGEATGGLASVRVLRATEPGGGEAPLSAHSNELHFLFVLEGSVSLETDSEGNWTLNSGDSAAVPAEEPHRLAAPSDDLQLLDVRVTRQAARP